MMSDSVVTTIVVAACIWGLAAAGESRASSAYPNKPIRIIVPVAPGGGTDFTARFIGQKLNEAWGQPIIVDNRPGAAGNRGVEVVSKAPADGYTLLMSITSFSSNPSIYEKLPFDTENDFAPIILVASAPLLLVVNPNLSVKSVKDLIALAKAKQGHLNYGSTGIGTTNHLAAELFKRMAAVEMVNVTYKGGGPAVVDLIAGNIQMYFSTIPVALNQTRAGRLRALAVTSLKRVPVVADVPTVAESGLTDFDVVGWFGLFAPASTPRAVIENLNSELVKILQMSDVQDKFSAHGLISGGGTSNELGKFLRAEIRKWRALIKDAGITLG